MGTTGSTADSFAGIVTHLDQLSTALEANAADLPHLETRHVKLKALLGEAHEVVTQQKVHTATKQDLSRQIKTLLAKCRRVSSFLRAGVREHYGAGSEKLVEFDMQPLRSRTRLAKQKVTKATPAKPAADAQTSDPAATES